jgi:phosphoadenosine phosphosulfate reductase
MSIQIRIAQLQKSLTGRPARDVIAAIVKDAFPGRVAVACSFGTEAAALLHLVASVDAATPILFIDTGRHFPETLHYRDALSAHLGLTDVRSIGPTPHEIARLDADSSRASWDPSGCCAFRKVAPLKKALAGFDAWITGLMPFQASTRGALALLEADGPRVKVNPLWAWTGQDLDAYEHEHALPSHPLIAQGYLSIGCAPCTTPVKPGEDIRAGRWRGHEKTECGIHLPLLAEADVQ